MKLAPRSLFLAVLAGLIFAPVLSFADYMPAEQQLERLENIVTLTSDQKTQALQIYQNLKDVMDDMNPKDRPQKGMQSRKDAITAIRSILTPEQQAIYDRTPQRLGGSGAQGDPAMRALSQKIRSFVINVARTSPTIAAQVGTVQKVVLGTSSMDSGGDPTTTDDPALHPESGSNLVKVTGSSGAKVFKISWTMNESDVMTVDKIQLQSS